MEGDGWLLKSNVGEAKSPNEKVAYNHCCQQRRADEQHNET